MIWKIWKGWEVNLKKVLWLIMLWYDIHHPITMIWVLTTTGVEVFSYSLSWSFMRSDKLCPLPYNMTAERVSEAITLYYTVGKQREQAHIMENPLVLNFDTLRGTLQSLLLFIFIKKILSLVHLIHPPLNCFY